MNKQFTIPLAAILLFTTTAHPALAAETQITTDQSAAVTTNVVVAANQELVSTTTPALAQITVGAALVQPSKPTLKEYAETVSNTRFGKGQYAFLDKIITHESNWNPEAVNYYSGACGLGQFLPCAGLINDTATDQIQKVVDYIASRYATPEKAWAFWQAHNWY